MQPSACERGPGEMGKPVKKPSADEIDDPNHWRERAREARERVLAHPDGPADLEMMVEAYEELARRAEARRRAVSNKIAAPHSRQTPQ